MIARYGPCICITIFRFLRWKLELCYAPADYSPPEHVHENSDGEFTILYSKNRRIYRKTHLIWPYAFDGKPVKDKVAPPLPKHLRSLLVSGDGDSYVATTPDVWGKWLSVRAGTPHGFDNGDSCMIWLCFERWKPGVKVTSVADDFVLT